VQEKRVFFVWEKELEKQLLMLLLTAQWRMDVFDERIWEDGDPNYYSVGVGYKALKEFDLS